MCNYWLLKIFFTTFILYLFFFLRLYYLMVNKVDHRDVLHAVWPCERLS